MPPDVFYPAPSVFTHYPLFLVHDCETAYTVYDVVGWRGYHGQPVLWIAKDVPDRYWYGEKPRILKAHKGTGVDELIVAVNRSADAYP